jgi:malonate transporter MadL subunit
MAIYGTALLSICLLLGLMLGKLLGFLAGIDANIGGVGFAMLLLILSTDWLRSRRKLKAETEAGVLFWAAIYIPVIVAMAACLNVRAALNGGWIAIVASVLTVVACVYLVPLVARLGRRPEPPEK